jgi:hypothetical protein
MTRKLALPLLVLFVCLAVPQTADGQEPPRPDPPQASTQAPEASPPLAQFGFGLMIGIPVGEFSENVNVAAGISGHLDFALGRSPISVGVESSVLWYGEESRDVPLQGIPDLAVEVTTSNDIILLHGRVRAQKRLGRVRPYADGLVGFIRLSTTSSFGGDVECVGTVCTTEGGDSVTHISDYAFNAGGGVGVMFAFGASPHSVRLDVSLRYLYGGAAEYLPEGFNPINAPPVLQPFRTRTDMLAVYIGLAFGR